MKQKTHEIILLCVIMCANVWTVCSVEDEDSYGEIMGNVEEGTKGYEFQLDTGARKDDRPDSELTYLELLDRNISRILMDPQKGQGPLLMKFIQKFAEEALQLRDMLLNKTTKVDNSLVESAIKVYQRYGHPRFMTVIVTNGGEHLQNTLDLSDDSMWDFYGYRQKANEFWDDIRAVLVQKHRSDKIEAERFRNLPWPKHLDNLTDFEKAVLEKSDIDSDLDLANVLNVKSTLF
uniref:Uncharacterized protein n=1 Tax=Homalodisca liturata TaxID=320908 RepID=A0A1B6JW43_9HEMI